MWKRIMMAHEIKCQKYQNVFWAKGILCVWLLNYEIIFIFSLLNDADSKNQHQNTNPHVFEVVQINIFKKQVCWGFFRWKGILATPSFAPCSKSIKVSFQNSTK